VVAGNVPAIMQFVVLVNTLQVDVNRLRTQHDRYRNERNDAEDEVQRLTRRLRAANIEVEEEEEEEEEENPQ
jgi:hypothetical protein